MKTTLVLVAVLGLTVLSCSDQKCEKQCPAEIEKRNVANDSLKNSLSQNKDAVKNQLLHAELFRTILLEI
ncbi:MAG: hypothetical protein AAF717_17090 [Bacteroidota bacterium]